jgi:hypothetical protein
MSPDGKFLIYAGQDTGIFQPIEVKEGVLLALGRPHLLPITGPTSITFVDHGENAQRFANKR